MTAPEARRISRELTAEDKARVQRLREQIAVELPEMTAIATQAGVSPVLLDEFLTGERNLRSDVMDRLAGVLGYGLAPVRAGA